MKFFKLKKFLSILSVIVAGSAIVFLLIITRTNHPSMSENDVRSQLEQTYDAEVAVVKKNEAVYDALITKNGNVYSVEMNALTGEVYSLKQTDEYIIQTESEVVEGPVELIPEKSSQPVEKHDEEKVSEEPKVIVIEKAPEKVPAKLIISDKKTATNKQTDGAEKPEQSENTTTKSIISATSKIEEKIEEDKPQKEISKDSSKVETSKQEETKAETPKEETAKTEDKVEAIKLVPAKAEATKVEEQKKEETQVQVTTSNTAQSEVKKPEAESKTETVTTVLISEEQAIKKAQQQQKGTVESSSFVKTNEGGYYLIVMKATTPEGDNKENAKEKKTKATIQVHAISGKILSVTWE